MIGDVGSALTPRGRGVGRSGDLHERVVRELVEEKVGCLSRNIRIDVTGEHKRRDVGKDGVCCDRRFDPCRRGPSETELWCVERHHRRL